jgi:hypothetical protein
MVERFVLLAAATTASLMAEVEKSPLSRLPPRTQFKAVGSLILLTIGGVALVVLSWMMLRAGRRAFHRDDARVGQQNHTIDRDDWARHPLPPNTDPSADTPNTDSE